MAQWSNWSGSFHGVLNEILAPTDLHELIAAVAHVGGREGRLHAEGSRWAFSAPAYCEDVVIDTSNLHGFAKVLQAAVHKPVSAWDRYLVAVEAGIKIRDLYRALAFDRDRDYQGPRPYVPSEPGRIWTLPVLGGAGGQSLAGAISTGTHGGDAQRPPLSDAVRAMVVVATGGRVLFIQPAGPELVDVDQLSADLGVRLEFHADTAFFDAALVSVGRLGIVWAYILEVHDESSVAIVEKRTRSTWRDVRAGLAAEAAGAAAADEFLQVVINPLRQDDGDHTCFITRHYITPGHPTDPAADPALPYVVDARSTTGCALALQLLSSPVAPAALTAIPALLPVLITSPIGTAITAQIVGHLAAIGTVGTDGEPYLAGDAFADIVRTIDIVDPEWMLLRAVHAELLALEQRDHIVHEDDPWMVKGTRFEIADFYDYANTNSYRGDSVELFFPVDETDPAALASTVDRLLAVFDRLAKERLHTAAYFAMRFMARTRATLGLARWPLTCSVEVACLRGMPGNPRLLNLLQEVAVEAGGVVHWGQQNDLTPAQVERGFGPALDAFCRQIPVADAHRLFRNHFSVSHGLEPLGSATWSGWTDLGQWGGRGAAAVPGGFDSGAPIEVFGRNSEGVVEALRLDAAGHPAAPWRNVRPEAVTGDPVLFRGISGRLELFVVDAERLVHTYERSAGGSDWEAWNAKGGEADRFGGQPAVVSVAAHSDGRLEVFGQAAQRQNFRVAHCWAHLVDSAWSGVALRGDAPSGCVPSVANHRLVDGGDLLVVVATSDRGDLILMRQVDPGDAAGWTDWRTITTDFLSTTRSGPVLLAPPGQPMHLFVVGPGNELMLGTASHPDDTWGFSQVGVQVEPGARVAALFHDGRVWATGRSAGDEVWCADFVPGSVPAVRFLDAQTFHDVGLGGFTGTGAVEIVARRRDGTLFGRRVEPTP